MMWIQVLIVAVISVSSNLATGDQLSSSVDIKFIGVKGNVGGDYVFYKNGKNHFLIICKTEKKTGQQFQLHKWGTPKYDVQEISNQDNTAIFNATIRTLDEGNSKGQFVCELLSVATSGEGINSTIADVYFLEPIQLIHIQNVSNGQATPITNTFRIILEIGTETNYTIEFLRESSSPYTKLEVTYELNKDLASEVPFKIQYLQNDSGGRLIIDHNDRLPDVFITYTCTLYTPSENKAGRVQLNGTDGVINFVKTNSSSLRELSSVLMMIMVALSLTQAM